MFRKPTPKELLGFIILALLAGIIVGYVIVCIFLMVIGIVANNSNYFGLGIAGFALPIGLPTIVGDIKEWFF